MRSIQSILMSLFVLMNSVGFACADMSSQDRSLLTTSLMHHINDTAHQTGFPFFDLDSQRIEFLEFTHLHPMILERSGAFVMCADFRNKAGTIIELDFVLYPSSEGFRIGQTYRNQRQTILRFFRG